MYLVMEDKSDWAKEGIKHGYSIKRYVDIPDELLKILNYSFIENFKMILRDNKYRYIKERKYMPSGCKELCLGCLVEKNDESIHFAFKKEWREDVQIILSCFSNC